MTQRPVDYDPIDLSRHAFWEQSFEERELLFEELRDNRPVSYHRSPEGAFVNARKDRNGFWAVVRHQDVAAVSQRPELFCSRRGVQVELVPLSSSHRRVLSSMITMDAPQHSRLRRIIVSAFTPRTVRRLQQAIDRRAAEIAAEIVEQGNGDLVPHVAKLPVWTIAEIMGVPTDVRKVVYDASDELVGWNDPDVRAGREPAQVWADALDVLAGVSGEIAAARRANPADDVMTALVSGSVDGECLTDDEIAAFFVLLAVAGSDTSRHSTSMGIKALADHPDQWTELAGDLDGLLSSAVDEIVRWATPVMCFGRTATRDTQLGGRNIRAGDRVALYYCSANRDPRVFEDPRGFDIHRKPNPHLSFGIGAHYCLGTFLARSQIGALIRELIVRAPGLMVGQPVYLGGHFIRGIKELTYHV